MVAALFAVKVSSPAPPPEVVHVGVEVVGLASGDGGRAGGDVHGHGAGGVRILPAEHVETVVAQRVGGHCPVEGVVAAAPSK